MFRFIVSSICVVGALAAPAEQQRVLGKSALEGKGVLLLDPITYPVVVSHLSPELNVFIGIFDKRDSIATRPADQIPEDKSESVPVEVRKRFLNFAVDLSRDEKAEGTDNILFAQIMVNGTHTLRCVVKTLTY